MKWLVYFMIALFLVSSAFALECNEVVDSDFELLRDLTCITKGLIIGADDITIDCTDHKITGINGEVGIEAEGRKGIAIKNCDISGFTRGIFFNNVEDSTINTSGLSDNENGIELRDSSGIFMSNNAIINNNIGVGTYDSKDITIFNNVISQNQRGIVRYFFTNVVSEQNIFEENTEDIYDFNEIIPAEPDEVPEDEVLEEEEPEEIEEITETPLTAEELLNETIYLEYRLENINEDLINERLEELGKTSKDLEIKREITYEEGKTKVVLTIIPKKRFKDVDIYEKIPKCFALYVDLIVFEKPPKVLIEDPLIKWHFEELDVPTELVYSTADIMPEECEDLFLAIGLGEIIKPKKWWFAVVVLVLVAAVVIYFARYSKK
jgi:hypothetical protein